MVTGVLIIPHRALGSVGVVVPNYVDVVSTSASSGSGCRMEIRGDSASFEDLLRVVRAATDGRFSFIPTGDYEGAIRGELAEEVEGGSSSASVCTDSSSPTSVAKEHSRTMLVEDAIYWAGNGRFESVEEEQGEEQKEEQMEEKEQGGGKEETHNGKEALEQGATTPKKVEDVETDEQRRKRRAEIILKSKDKGKGSDGAPESAALALSSEAVSEQASMQSPTEEDLRAKSKEKHNRLTVFRKVLTRHKTYQAKVLARRERWVERGGGGRGGGREKRQSAKKRKINPNSRTPQLRRRFGDTELITGAEEAKLKGYKYRNDTKPQLFARQLSEVAQKGELDEVKRLLDGKHAESKFGVNAKTSKGSTALMAAARSLQFEVLVYLIAVGADVAVSCREAGGTAEEVGSSCERKREVVVRQLTRGNTLNARPRSRDQPTS